MLVSFDTNTREGGFDVLTHDVEKLTGRQPETLRALLEANAAAFQTILYMPNFGGAESPRHSMQ